MEKTFTVAGTSNLNGVVKFRFANDLAARVKVLVKNGHTDVKLVELPEPMTKADAIAFLEGAAEPQQQGPALAVTEAAIASVMATLPARNCAGHFMSKDFLRSVALRELAA